MIKVIEGSATVSGDLDTILAELFVLMLHLRGAGIRTVDIFNIFLSGMVANLNAYGPDAIQEEYDKEEERLLTMSLKDRISTLFDIMEAERNMQ